MTKLTLDRQPVIVGVGQLRNNTERRPERAREPLDLIVDALGRAASDSGAGRAILARADTITIVSVGTWAYDDLPGLVSKMIGAEPRRRTHTDVGGNRPAEALDAAAARIAAGESQVELLAGAEARASLLAIEKAGAEPQWTRQPGGPVQYGESVRGSKRMWAHGLMAPVRFYPFYENALRVSLGQTFEEAQLWSGEILSDFTSVASAHGAAWNRQVRSPAEIYTVTPENRYICFPYPLLMNSFPNVDQAAAVVVTSVQAARNAGVAEERMIHVWGGAGATDSKDVLDRLDYSRSPGLEYSLTAALQRGGLEASQLDVIDLYACFPVVPKLGLLTLGLPRTRRVTATGGNTAFGGPGNNFSMHAIASVVDELRAGGRIGLVYANGEYVTKHHAVLLSRDPHVEGYVGSGDQIRDTSGQGPRVVDDATGEATIETWTVEFDRAGRAATAFVIGRRPDGARFAAISRPGDQALLHRLTDPSQQVIGSSVQVRPEGGRNVVSSD
jgi:acetyl-CoA C-acetyltransferase